MSPDRADRLAYYKSALAALRFLEARSPTNRRFGADADARWSAFRGHLATADRLDVLLRDADAQWPGSFGARTVFATHGVAEDEAFGADWTPLDPVPAEEVWRAAMKPEPPAALRALWSAWSEAWGEKVGKSDAGAIAPGDAIVVAGPSAIAAVLERFAEARGLDWAEQVVVVASRPSHRQLAAFGGAIMNATKPTTIVGPGATVRRARWRAVASADAEAADRAFAEKLGGSG